MSIDTKDIYRDFNADYGVLVGRVNANNGIGVPNARISIFIPVMDEDTLDGSVMSIYPYKTPRDKNADGKRYNLLPRVGKRNPETQVVSPKQPFGSFPIKEEFVVNEPFLDVYKKYYKYTALTNDSGDYMIFGVPVGVQTVHMSVDITDIGEYSMTPAAMVTNLGYSENLFTENNTKIKESTDLNDLPHIELQDIAVDIAPFWGDTENFEIGITRQDFRVRSTLVNTFVVFGSVFTDADNSMWGQDVDGDTRRINELSRLYGDQWKNISIYSKRPGRVTEKIYTYKSTVKDSDINNADPENDMIVLDKSEYSVYKRDGDFVFIINCNRGKVITSETGEVTPVENSYQGGVYTTFKGFITLEIIPDDLPMNFHTNIGNNTEVTPYRVKLKFPQYANRNRGFAMPGDGTADEDTDAWRKQHFTFESGKFYSFARFHGTTYLRKDASSNHHTFSDGDLSQNNGFWNETRINHPYHKDSWWNAGVIVTGTVHEETSENANYQFPSNSQENTGEACFGAQWLNLSVFLPQLGYMSNGYAYISYVKTSDYFSKQNKRSSEGGYNGYFVGGNNTQPIAGGDFNTKSFLRSDLHWTDIIEVPVEDIDKMKNKITTKGFKDDVLSSEDLLIGKYRNGLYKPTNWTTVTTPCPLNGGKLNGWPDNSNPADQRTYFYKGQGDANCIDYLYELGILV
ncbi:MAG: hypothetical protein WC333_01125 [Dehalococcoidia bacterium]